MPSIVVPLNTAINGMASLLGITPVSSKYFARLLREDGDGLWPEIGRGRRSGAVSVSDLVNLWMAIVLSEGQPSDCPRVLREFRMLRVVNMTEIASVEDPATQTGHTFRRQLRIDKDWTHSHPRYLFDQFEWLIELLAIDIINNRPIGGDKSDWPEFCITLGSGSSPMTAIATYLDEKKKLKKELERKSSVDEYSSQVNALANFRLPYARLNRLARTQILIGRDEILALAQFVAEAAKVEADPNSSMTPGSVKRGNSTSDKKKASGTGIHEGLQSEQPAPKAETACSHKLQSATGKGRKQSSRPSAAGSGAGQRSTSDQQEDKTSWDSHSVSPKAPVACSDMFERLTA